MARVVLFLLDMYGRPDKSRFPYTADPDDLEAALDEIGDLVAEEHFGGFFQKLGDLFRKKKPAKKSPKERDYKGKDPSKARKGPRPESQGGMTREGSSGSSGAKSGALTAVRSWNSAVESGDEEQADELYEEVLDRLEEVFEDDPDWEAPDDFAMFVETL